MTIEEDAVRARRAGAQAGAGRAAALAQRRDPAAAGLRGRAREDDGDGPARSDVRRGGGRGRARTAWSPPTTWPTPAGRCSCSRRSPRSAAPCAATRDVAPRLRARHVQRVLPAGRRLAGRSGPSGWRSTVWRWRHAPAVLGPPAAGRRLGAAAPRPRRSPPALMDEQHPGDGEAWLELCARVGPDRSAPRRRAALAVPAGPGRARAAGRGCAASAGSTSSGRC